MSQYKESMARLMGGGANKSSSPSPAPSLDEAQIAAASTAVFFVDGEGEATVAKEEEVSSMPEIAETLQRHAHYILRVVAPCLWVILLLLYMDRDSFLRTMFMPFIGVFAALLANCIPIGGGIVYVPVLSLLGTEVKLSVSFTVATMTIGNGVFGFLHWLQTDPSLIVWESFYYTVLPCSLGSTIGILLLPPLNASWVKSIFGVFCLLVAAYAALLAHAQGVDDNNKVANHAQRVSGPRPRPKPNAYQWAVVGVVHFLSGLILVTNIGIGPALIAYFMLGDNYLGYTQKQSIVTGIVTGGWVSAVPFLLHAFVLGDVPVQLWIMVLPGVYAGALLAPKVYELVGMQTIFAAFSLFLVLSAGMFLW